MNKKQAIKILKNVLNDETNGLSEQVEQAIRAVIYENEGAHVKDEINLTEILEITSNLVDKNFPKGCCKERGQALVLHAEMIIEFQSLLLKKGDK